MDLAIAVGVFVAMGFLDYAWVVCVQAVNQKHYVRAVVGSVSTQLLSAVGVLGYTHDAIYLVPATVGGVIGTILAMHFDRKKQPTLPAAWARAAGRSWLNGTRETRSTRREAA